jgi:hypothetical protein
MPAYLAGDAGGRLPWSWAEQRLVSSHCYWIGTVWPDRRPHVSPVWGVWLEDRLWFSCDPTSRKAPNLRTNPSCVVTTEDPLEPVIVDGTAHRVTERDDVVRYVDAERVKYAAEWKDDTFTVEFFIDGTYVVVPTTVLGLVEKEFDTSPTRWTF